MGVYMCLYVRACRHRRRLFVHVSTNCHDSLYSYYTPVSSFIRPSLNLYLSIQICPPIHFWYSRKLFWLYYFWRNPSKTVDLTPIFSSFWWPYWSVLCTSEIYTRSDRTVSYASSLRSDFRSRDWNLVALTSSDSRYTLKIFRRSNDKYVHGSDTSTDVQDRVFENYSGPKDSPVIYNLFTFIVPGFHTTMLLN